MKPRTRWLLLTLATVALAAPGCHLIMWLGYPSYEINYATHAFPAAPTNLGDLNSPADDMNAAPPPTLQARFPLVFSSNRGGKGFDLVAYYVDLSFDQDGGELHLWSSPDVVDPELLVELGRINSEYDELGPLNRHPGWMFASDRGGKGLDIYRLDGEEPEPWADVNSEADDAYPAMPPVGSPDWSYCSNRAGRFDIYGPDGPRRILNSPADDKCPFVFGDRMFFTSNRPGGHGGFDLYVSRWVGRSWTEPVNLGPEINSAHDEYRPVFVPAPEFSNDLLIFSSNRPGGKGGFDLYYSGFAR